MLFEVCSLCGNCYGYLGLLVDIKKKQFTVSLLNPYRVNEVEELCKGSLESVYSLYPTLCRLQLIGELENIGLLFSRYFFKLVSYSFLSFQDFW